MHQPAGEIPVTTNVRDALSAVLAAGGEPLKVIGDDGEVLGLATLEAIGGVLKNGSHAARSECRPAGRQTGSEA